MVENECWANEDRSAELIIKCCVGLYRPTTIYCLYVGWTCGVGLGFHLVASRKSEGKKKEGRRGGMIQADGEGNTSATGHSFETKGAPHSNWTSLSVTICIYDGRGYLQYVIYNLMNTPQWGWEGCWVPKKKGKGEGVQ